uniref:Uncharacterized protein n=1 Tax=Arundo donax TaxID=35708 RepID=A0A0A9B6G8_ARUDO
MAPRLPLVGALLLLLLLAVVLAQLGALSCEGDSLRLRGFRRLPRALDCAAGQDLSGVVVAAKCAGDDGTGLPAAESDVRGDFEMAMPASASPCAARVLGATEQLCAPQGLTVARVVPERRHGSSYALGSRLAFFTRCGASGFSAGVVTTTAAGDQGHAPRVPASRPKPSAGSTPRAGGKSPPIGMGGLPLIYFFPFLPIIGIP